jgi:hypothetical protein
MRIWQPRRKGIRQRDAAFGPLRLPESYRLALPGPRGGTVEAVEVTFTKLAGRRYLMTVTRERSALALRQGPGYDDHLPHDAVHLLVRRLRPACSDGWPPVRATSSRRRSEAAASSGPPPGQAPHQQERADMARSELLASICPPLWELRSGRRSELPEWFSSVEPRDLASPVVERIIERLDDFAARWHALPEGDSITLPWLPPSSRPAPSDAPERPIGDRAMWNISGGRGRGLEDELVDVLLTGGGRQRAPSAA